MKKILIAFLFVLSMGANAFAAPMSMDGCISDESFYCCETSDCNDLTNSPQSQLREYKSIKGTVYAQLNPNRVRFDNFVKVEYKSDSGTHNKTFFITSSFGFGILSTEQGTVTFTAWRDNKPDPDYEVIVMRTEDFNSFSGNDILMKKKTASSGTGTGATPPASSGTDTTPPVQEKSKTEPVNTRNTIRVSGTVYLGNDKSAPLSYVRVGPKGLTFTTHNSGISRSDGVFTIERFPTGYPLIAQFYTTNDTEISYNDVLKNQNNLAVFIPSGDGEDVDKIEATTVFGDCMTENKKKSLHAKSGEYLSGVCIPTECESDRYKLVNPKTVRAQCEDQVNYPCTPEDDQYALSGHYEWSRNALTCVSDTCVLGYEVPRGKTKCEASYKDRTGEKCTDPELKAQDPHATAGTVSMWDETTGKAIMCDIKDCDGNYVPDRFGQTCISSNCPCRQEWDSGLEQCVPWKNTECKVNQKGVIRAERDCDAGGKEYCRVAECEEPAYSKNEAQNRCDSNVNKPCSPEDVAAIDNAVSGTYVVENGMLLCKPKCNGSNFDAKLVGNKFECQMKQNLDNAACNGVELRKITGDSHAATGTVTDWDRATGKIKACKIITCNGEYEADANGSSCVSTKCPCGDWDDVKKECGDWKDKNCSSTSKPKLPTEATSAIKQCDANRKPYCKITGCSSEYILENAESDRPVCTLCTKKVTGSKTAHFDAATGVCVADSCKSGLDPENGRCDTSCEGKVPFATRTTVKDGVCVPSSCRSGFKKSPDGSRCIVDCSKHLTALYATRAEHKTIPAEGIQEGLPDYSIYCYATACDGKKFKLVQGTEDTQHCESTDDTDCTITHGTGKLVGGKCVLESCDSGYKKNTAKNKCDYQIDQPCPTEFLLRLDLNATKGKITEFADEVVKACKITDCNSTDLTPAADDGLTCVPVCNPAEKAALEKQGAAETATKNGKCIIKSCKCGYEKKGDKCESWTPAQHPSCTNRTDPRLPEDARKAHMECDNSNPQKAYCMIEKCVNDMYEISDVNGLKDAACKARDKNCKVQGKRTYESEDGTLELVDGKALCIPKDCGNATGYEVNKKTGKCEPKDNQCPDEILHKMDPNAAEGTITERNSDGSAEKCKIKRCNGGLSVEDEIRCVDSKCGCGQKYVNGGKCEDIRDNDGERDCYKGLVSHAETPGKLMCQHNNTKKFDFTCDKAEKCKEVCVVQTCKDGYVADVETNKCKVPTGDCKDAADFTDGTDYITSGKYTERGGKVVCEPVCNGSNYKANWDSANGRYTGCVIKRDREGKACNGNTLRKVTGDQNADKGIIITQLPNGDPKTCEITECNKGYNLQKDADPAKHKCVVCECGTEWSASDNKCIDWTKTQCDPMPTGAKTATRACKDKTSGAKKESSECNNASCVEYCEITECDEPNYSKVGTGESAVCEPNANKPCTDEQLKEKEHATAGVQQDKNGTLVCIVSACDAGYEVRPDGSGCAPKMVLSKEDYQKQIAELTENAQKMREKETSLENRIIGAAGIGATGIGGAMLGAAISETAADAAAERDMNAYLKSFHCDYGAGKNVAGGEINVELPGGNDMISLYTEYAQLANDLKIRKEALGIRPGIESEVVIDKSETGLYDDVGTGITGGTYASIARALLNPEGEDAAMWAAQKEKTKNTLIAGAVTAGVGAVGSGVANILVNNNNPNKSDEIKRRYEAMRIPFDQLQESFQREPKKQCADVYPGSTGSDLNNCKCINPNAYLAQDRCVECGTGKVVNETNDGCVCKDPKQILVGDTCQTQEQPPESQNCPLANQLRDPKECECVFGAASGTDNICRCKTDDGYTKQNDSCVCDESRGYTNGTNGTCTCNTANGYVSNPSGGCKKLSMPTSTPIAQASISADSLFDTGKATIKTSAKTNLDNFITKAKGNSVDLKTADDYCLVIVGKTDYQGFSSTSPYYNNGGNQKLSEHRANAVKDYVKDAFNENAIKAMGIAATDCPVPKKGQSKANANCRRVDILMLAGSCSDNMTLSHKVVSWIGNVAETVEAKNDVLKAIGLGPKNNQ